MLAEEMGEIFRAGSEDALRDRGLLRGYRAPRVIHFVQNSAGAKVSLGLDRRVSRTRRSDR